MTQNKNGSMIIFRNLSAPSSFHPLSASEEKFFNARKFSMYSDGKNCCPA
jgi:hypothetical protein